MLNPTASRRPLALVGLALTSLWASACLYEWDGYDPREANQCVAGATRVCYTGPAGTQDVGVCRSGNQSGLFGFAEDHPTGTTLEHAGDRHLDLFADRIRGPGFKKGKLDFNKEYSLNKRKNPACPYFPGQPIFEKC